MRILFVNPYYKPYLGGIERIIERMGQELESYSDIERVGVLTTRAHFPDRWMADLPSHEMMEGVEIFRCTFRPSRIPRVFHAALAGYVSAQVRSVIKNFRPDVVHFVYGEWWAGNVNVFLASPRARHVFSTIYHDVPRTRGTWPLYVANRWLVRRMDAVHVLSQFEQRQVEAAYSAPIQRTVVIPPGVDVPASFCRRPASNVTTILAVGRLNSHKGQLRLVEMVKRLTEEIAPVALKLWLVGDDAGDRTSIEEYARQHSLGDVVTIFGHCSDQELDELYTQADIFALPTQYESFGIVFIEAMARGLPVVTYGVGPVPSILTGGALVVPPHDEAAFRCALRDLVQRPKERARLGEEGYNLVKDRYSWRATTHHMHDLYGRILASEPPTRGQPKP